MVFRRKICFRADQKAADAVDDGHYALKMYPLAQIQPNGTLRHPTGRYSDNLDAVTAGIELVRAVRQVVGPDIRLMLDFGGGVSIADTMRFCERIKEYDIEFVEEITDPGDLGALSQVASSIDIPIATGERHYLRQGFRDLLEKRVISILQPDIGNAGGFAEVHKISAMADAYGFEGAAACLWKLCRSQHRNPYERMSAQFLYSRTFPVLDRHIRIY